MESMNWFSKHENPKTPKPQNPKTPKPQNPKTPNFLKMIRYYLVAY